MRVTIGLSRIYDVTDLIYFECGVDSVSKQVANDSYPIPIASVYFEDAIFRENEVEYIIRPVNKGIVHIVELNRAVFSGNNVINGIILLDYASVYIRLREGTPFTSRHTMSQWTTLNS